MFDDARVLCALGGFLVLAHACYAVISYRDELKIAGDEFEGVPVQVAVECAIGAAMCAWQTVVSTQALLVLRSSSFNPLYTTVCAGTKKSTKHETPLAVTEKLWCAREILARFAM